MTHLDRVYPTSVLPSAIIHCLQRSSGNSTTKYNGTHETSTSEMLDREPIEAHRQEGMTPTRTEKDEKTGRKPPYV